MTVAGKEAINNTEVAKSALIQTAIIVNTVQEEQPSQFGKKAVSRDETGRYNVSWLWEREIPKLVSNFVLCLSRLKSTLRKLQVKERTKWRVVFDASVFTRMITEQRALQRTLFVTKFVQNPFTFSQSKIVVLADAEKTFPQLGLQEQDRDCTRFLRLRDTKKPVTELNRVPFGAISNPFLLAATLRKHFKNEIFFSLYPPQSYVDNAVITANNTKEAIQKCKETKELFTKAKRASGNFMHSNKEFMIGLPTKDAQ
ncbi:unnamed protein product [Gongylonema pulchrum]|uniref:Reverse transcriptase domain-containing protein n=1 Tax=Gongylonema pulchrum TaxID=637853 RepID=A0A183CWP9_9BILA|nr:unnamed protein product [Gongylonema pulchrum]